MDDVIFSLQEGLNILLKILLGSAIITVIIFVRFLFQYSIFSVERTIVSGFKSDGKETSDDEEEDENGLGLFLLRTFILSFLGIIAFLLIYTAFIESYKVVFKFLTDYLFFNSWLTIFKILVVGIYLGLCIYCFYYLYNFSDKLLKRFRLKK